MKWASNPIRELCVIPPPEPPCPGQVRAVRDGASRRYSYERWGEQGFNVSAPIVLFPPPPSAKLVSCVPVPSLSLHFVLFICPRNVPVQMSHMLCTKSQMNFDFYVLSKQCKYTCMRLLETGFLALSGNHCEFNATSSREMGCINLTVCL